MKVSEVADLVGISVRTLHYYDQIGLLTPAYTDLSRYRVYSDQDLEKLQQILFFKQLDFPLKKIKEIMNDPDYDQNEALEMQRNLLLEKRNRLDQVIKTINKSIRYRKGEVTMSKKEKFAGFDFSKNPYEAEARKRWGDSTVDQTNEKLERMNAQDKKAFQDQFNDIYRELAEIRHIDPASEMAQKEIKKWYDYLNKIGNYPPTVFKGLGQMYVEDERFTKNIDQFGEGLAEFMCAAMEVFADRNK